MATVPLVNLLDALLQKAYHDLNVLQELLRNKSDGDRKVEIVKYAQQTRALLIRLLALVKWAGTSSSVQKCAEMSAMLSQQSGLYVDTADQLVQLVRSTLVNACAPNFSLAPALDVLITGSYPRLPTCIQDRIIPLPGLEEAEQEQAHTLLTSAIRRRLLRETVPEPMTISSIGEGVISFKVPYEFEMQLSVLGDDPAMPWRLISLTILVGAALPDKPLLLNQHQKLFLHQVVQSRLYSEERALQDCYECLHSFCLSLQLDCLHAQAIQLSNEVYGGYVKVEEYTHAHHLKVVYWRPGTSQLMSTYLMEQAKAWPKILISIDPQSSEPFSTHHSPPLPPGETVAISPGSQLSLETLVKRCVQVRSHALLKDVKDALKGSPWEARAELGMSPLCLRINVPLKYGSCQVVLGVDPRVGSLVAAMDTPCTTGKVPSCLEELEKLVSQSLANLPAQLTKLQCHLFVAHVSELAEELNLPVHSSLPLVDPLPFHYDALVFLELHPFTYMLVGVVEGLLDQYHLLVVTSTSPTSPVTHHTPEVPLPPKIFFATTSLIELDPDDLILQHLRRVKVSRGGPILKRKMKESSLSLPCLKRVCLRDGPEFSPLPGLITARMVLLSMEMSLNTVGISYSTSYTRYGAPSADIFSFPQCYDGSQSLHELLSNNLKSCSVTHSLSTYSCTFVFSPLDLGGQSGDGKNVILRQSVAAPQQRGVSEDLGQTLLGQWQARVNLLAITLELHQYLEGESNKYCSITSFTYDQLSLSFEDHQLSVKATPTGLSLSLSQDCPHRLLQASLEGFLRDTRSLPLLLQGIYYTAEAMGTLTSFAKQVSAIQVSASTPAQVQVTYANSFSLSLELQTNSTVAFTGIRSMKSSTNQLNALNYLQTFLQSVLSSVSGDQSEDSAEKPASVSNSSQPPKPSLYPTPSPISYPRRISWPESVPSPRHGFMIPSIPPFPSPAGAGTTTVGPHGLAWHCLLPLDQFQLLLSATPPQHVKPELYVSGCSLLESFFGSLALLFHSLQLVLKQQMIFVQSDLGLHTYRTDSLAVTMGMEGAVYKLTLKSVRDNVWSPIELEALTTLFKTEVMSSPFSLAEVQAFLSLFTFPLPVLKSVVQLICHQQTPPAGMVWNMSLCLTIPPDTDLSSTPFTKGSPAIIYGRGKLLLYLRMERVQDKKTLVLPLMYDPKTNVTYVARFHNQYQNTVHPFIDSVLKKASQEFAAGQVPGHPSSSLFPSVLSLAQTQLPS